ncbi:MAG: type II toxin-antitoxin system RelE/ParE family toxin [Candidatus Methanoperedens sp.]|nr:type II toxin-antitoxin system RelE/ParE family toxin [Candidatus Methanoperedens sp.]
MTQYTVLIHKKIIKSIKNLPKSHLEKFESLIETLKINPYPWKDFDLRKIEGTENTYRVRFGDYRVVYYVDREQKTVHVLKIDIRRKVYK